MGTEAADLRVAEKTIQELAEELEAAQKTLLAAGKRAHKIHKNLVALGGDDYFGDPIDDREMIAEDAGKLVAELGWKPPAWDIDATDDEEDHLDDDDDLTPDARKIMRLIEAAGEKGLNLRQIKRRVAGKRTHAQVKAAWDLLIKLKYISCVEKKEVAV